MTKKERQRIENNLRSYKAEALYCARSLHYGEETMERIQKATTESEVARAMITARERKMKEERR